MGGYVVDVSSIMAEAGASLEVDDDVPLKSLVVGDTVAVFDVSPHLRATISNTGEGLVLLGTVEGTAQLECSRCLEPFTRDLTGSLEGVLTPEDRRHSLAEDEEWYPLTPEGMVDLLPAVHAALAIEIPYAPLHDEECRGICPTCGCDRNRDSCDCVEDGPDISGPFAVLKDLIDGDKDS